ncbi:CD209 antigen-like protein 2 isoform X2 [Nelusetta ayraudi]|uniref:CD209 antigen-like protein 2 isoform X2 n=1 Tax=Nelusetta ayraudi TaxID=303726 RepID=UPI003F70DFA4
MSCNVYEGLWFNLAERWQADVGECQMRPVEIYESADGLDVHQGHAAPPKGGAPVEKPLPVGQRNWFRPALLPLVLLSLLFLLVVGILSALYALVTQERDRLAQSLQQDQHQDELSSNLILCQEGGNNVPAGSHTGWRRFGCSCYYRSEQQRNWTESQRQCQRSGGDLVSIESREEQFVKLLNGNRASWIGLYLMEGNWKEPWKWMDGSTFSYTNWGVGWKQKSGESKAFINTEGLWDTANTASKYWICEKPILKIEQDLK